MGIGTIIFGILGLAGVALIGRLLLKGVLSGRMVAFHYMAHIAEWRDNRFGYITITLYNLFWFVLSVALLTATALGRFN